MSCSGKKAFTFTAVLILLAAFCRPLPAQETAAWVDFQQKAAAWRALPVKPAISEEVRLERVQAENAVREKRLEAAVEHYESGLKMNPVWPEGHFNAALLYAELEEYDKAIWQMRAYVELVPDAQDARGARDQTAIWQDKLKLQDTVVFRDPVTKLMWAKQDNGGEVLDWQADNYCHNLSLGGYSGWRLPAAAELNTIKDKKQSVNGNHIKGGIKLYKGCVWTNTTGGGGPHISAVSFRLTNRSCVSPSVLCVRRPGE